MAAESFEEQIMDAMVRCLTEEVTRPHLVVCTDPVYGALSYSGPYSDGLTALVMAEKEQRAARAHDDESRLQYAVAPLLPPLTVNGFPGPHDVEAI